MSEEWGKLGRRRSWANLKVYGLQGARTASRQQLSNPRQLEWIGVTGAPIRERSFRGTTKVAQPQSVDAFEKSPRMEVVVGEEFEFDQFGIHAIAIAAAIKRHPAFAG